LQPRAPVAAGRARLWASGYGWCWSGVGGPEPARGGKAQARPRGGKLVKAVGYGLGKSSKRAGPPLRSRVSHDGRLAGRGGDGGGEAVRRLGGAQDGRTQGSGPAPPSRFRCASVRPSFPGARGRDIGDRHGGRKARLARRFATPTHAPPRHGIGPAPGSCLAARWLSKALRDRPYSRRGWNLII